MMVRRWFSGLLMRCARFLDDLSDRVSEPVVPASDHADQMRRIQEILAQKDRVVTDALAKGSDRSSVRTGLPAKPWRDLYRNIRPVDLAGVGYRPGVSWRPYRVSMSRGPRFEITAL